MEIVTVAFVVLLMSIPVLALAFYAAHDYLTRRKRRHRAAIRLYQNAYRRARKAGRARHKNRFHRDRKLRHDAIRSAVRQIQLENMYW